MTKHNMQYSLNLIGAIFGIILSVSAILIMPTSWIVRIAVTINIVICIRLLVIVLLDQFKNK